MSESTPTEAIPLPKPKKGGKRTPQRLAEEREREKRVMEMVLGGYTFTRIAEVVGYADASGAYRAYKRGLEATVRPAADEVRAQEEERLDHLTRVWLPLALGLNGAAPNRQAAEIMMKVMDRRAKMFGVDAPTKVEAKVEQVTSGVSIDAEVARLAALMAQEQATK